MLCELGEELIVTTSLTDASEKSRDKCRVYTKTKSHVPLRDAVSAPLENDVFFWDQETSRFSQSHLVDRCSQLTTKFLFR